MLNHSDEFEFALHRLVESLKANRLGPALGLKQIYLSRMANPNDQAAHFRARDLIPAMRLGLERLPADIALGPLTVQAHALGYALFPLPSNPTPARIISTLSRASRRFGDLGERSIVAIDPAGQGGPRITGPELALIENAGLRLAGHVGSVIHTCRALHKGGTHALA